MSGSPKKILIIRFSSIGDIVLTSPVIRLLKEQLQAEVHYLTKASYALILAANPHVDQVFTIQKNIEEVAAQLKVEKYDHIIDLHKNWRSLSLRKALGRPASSFNKLNIEKWLLTNLGINRLPELHIVDRYLESITGLGAKNDGKGLDYYIPASEVVNISTLLKKESPYIAFSIGAAHATKRLPEELLLAICQAITYPILLLGGPQEATSGKHIAQAAGEQVINQCGQLNLHQSASILQQAHLVISHDTGMMHIAAAFKKKVLSIWGNTVPAFGMYPYYPEGMDRNESFQVEGLKCRPCSKIGYAACPKGHFNCMQNQNVKQIAFRANTIMQTEC